MTTSAQPVPIALEQRNALGVTILAGYLLLYAATLFAMHSGFGFELGEPIFAFAILGVGFSLMAWLFTIGATPLPYVMAEPEKELATVVFYVLPVISFVTWGLGFLHNLALSAPADALTILMAKLVVFVVAPAALMRTHFGYAPSRLAPVSGSARHALAMIGISGFLVGFQAIFGRGLRDIAAAHVSVTTFWISVPLTLVWVSLEAGVVEEFFFRVLLQTRLSAVMRSELGAIVLTSLSFGLIHAPGLYLRTGLTQEGLPTHPSLLMAVGYSIMITSVAGFFLGVLWARTRNFAVIVLAHGMADLLPNILPTIRSLRLL